MKKLTVLFTVFIMLLTACEKPSEFYWGKDANRFWSKGKMSYFYLNRVVSDESNVVWSTGNHTPMPVPLGAVGPEEYVKRFNGIRQNTDITKILKDAVRDKKNVILVIGDGMGSVHMSLPILRNISLKNNEKTYFEKIMDEGTAAFCFTNMYEELVTGSGAASTAIATGSKTYLKEIGMDPKGYPTVSILDVAESLDCVTGLITDTKITDATPAGFYGNVIKRSMENEIARQLVMEYDIEVIMGGGAGHFVPVKKKMKETEWFQNWPQSENDSTYREDSLDLIKQIKDQEYCFVNSREELQEKYQNQKKLIGLFATGGLLPRIDRDDEKTYQPSITDMAKAGLSILNNHDKNYFLMIECGRIDWESHSNDAGSVALAVLEMDSVLMTAYEYYQKDPENTLLVFTADHETGGLAMSYYSTGKKIKDTLESGLIRETSLNSLHFSSYLKLFEQKKSLAAIFGMSHSAEELYENLKKYYPYEVSREEAKIIYHLDQGYTGK